MNNKSKSIFLAAFSLGRSRIEDESRERFQKLITHYTRTISFLVLWAIASFIIISIIWYQTGELEGLIHHTYSVTSLETPSPWGNHVGWFWFSMFVGLLIRYRQLHTKMLDGLIQLQPKNSDRSG